MFTSSSVLFGARFQKLPVPILAQLQSEGFDVKNPWGEEGYLHGQPGDYLVTNLFSNEQYPIEPTVLTEKYEHVRGEEYHTRTDKPVYIEAELPEGDTIESREGAEKTQFGGMPSVSAIDGAGKPYSIPADYFLKAYKAVDQRAREIVETLKEKIAAVEAKLETPG